jgi:hypothetical protein
MSAPTDTPSSTREMRQLIAGATAALTGRKRGLDKSVRRDSYDIEDPRAQVFRPIGDGTIAGAMGWIDALLQTAREFDGSTRSRDSGAAWAAPTPSSCSRRCLAAVALSRLTSRPAALIRR